MKKTISLLLVLSLGLANVSIAEDTWTTKANMPTSRLGFSTSAVDGKIYAIGGGNNIDGSAFRTVEMYNPVTDAWIKKADMSIQRYFHSASVMNGKVYIIGGATGVMVTTPNVDIYDPTTDTWMRKANMPTSRCFLSSCVVNGKIYAIGGRLFPGDLSVPTVEEYNPVTDTWTRKADMPTARCFLSTSMVNGKIYAIGGVSGSLFGRGISAVEEYDPVTDIWTKKADMPTARSSLSSSVVNGKIYAVGGGISGSGPVSSAVEEYDPITDSWTSKVDMPTARGLHSASVVDGKIYAIGGAVKFPPHNSVSTVEEYDLTPPPPDFNSDGIVDIEDLLLLIESWGQDNPLCDIAPPPFGDEIIDAMDLELLMSYWKQSIDDPTLIAHWALDETEGIIAADSVSENGSNDGVVIGDPVWQPDGGQVNGAIQLDGMDDYIITSPILNPADGPFSILGWVNSDLPGQVVVSQQDTANWLAMDTEGNLMTELKNSGRSTGPLFSQTVITDGQWYRIGFVWDGAKRALYVDDILVAEDAQANLQGSDSGLYIGTGKAMEPGTYWSGLIDDVRIYNRAVRP